MFQDSIGILKELAEEKLRIQLTPEQVEQFVIYGNLLLEWNQKMNLTRITEPEQIIVKHFLDSIALANYALGSSLCDIGTGAGFPGIPIKIALPGLEVNLVDSLNKRVDFLHTVIDQLKLTKTKAVHSRAEDFGRNSENRNVFASVTSRAVANLPVLLEYALPLLKIGGFFYALKGPQVFQEISEGKKALEVLGGSIEGIEELNLGPMAEYRAIIKVRKDRNTPSEYPRKAGLPEKKPL